MSDSRAAYALRAVMGGYVIVHVLHPTVPVDFAPGTYVTVYRAVKAAADAGYDLITSGTADSCSPTVSLIV